MLGGPGVPVNAAHTHTDKRNCTHIHAHTHTRTHTCALQGGRVYDSKYGVTCHWCRQKTLEEHVSARLPLALPPLLCCSGLQEACETWRRGPNMLWGTLTGWMSGSAVPDVPACTRGGTPSVVVPASHGPGACCVLRR